MKKILFLFAFMLSFCFQMEAQDKTVTNDLVYTIYGGVNDTVSKYTTKTYTFYVYPWCEVVKYRPALTRIGGTYTKARVIMQSSLDYVTWTAKDTVTLTGTGATLTGISKTSTIKDPYVRWLVSPYDSTQILRMKNTILIDK